MGEEAWRSENTEGNSQRITRRSVLASVTTGAIIGVAGCSGGDGGDGQTTTLPEEVEENMPTTAGSQSDSLIPGEIVHQNIEGIEVLDHWAEQDQTDWIKLEIQNNRDKPFKQPGAGYQGEEGVNIVRSRVLTEQGNQLSSDIWVRGSQFGPGKINPGTSGVIGIGSPAQQNAARYELCLHPKRERFGVAGFKKACTDWTPTASPTPTPGPGPGSNEVIHNGLDNVEVLSHERKDHPALGTFKLVVKLKNNGEYIKRFYVAAQFYDQWERYYPEREPAWVWMHPGTFTGTDDYDGFEAGETIKAKVLVEEPEDPIKLETYDICIDSTNNKLKAEKIIPTCEWPRDG